MSDFDDFAQLIEALRPWLSQLVIVGGWAHRLHRYHPLAAPPAYLPIQTRDADVAFSDKMPLEGDIDEALSAAGFRAEFSGEHTPPVTHYWLGNQDQGFYAEFLVPLVGGREDRNKRLVPLTVTKAGITAQKLRHLDILIAHPWAVRVDNSLGVPLKSEAEIQIANPVSFIAQKLLIQHLRPAGKKAQDALYIHDTLELFAAKLDELNFIWREIRPRIPRKTARDIERLAKEQFGAVTDIIRDAAQIPQNRRLAPENIQRACEYGLGEIFNS